MITTLVAICSWAIKSNSAKAVGASVAGGSVLTLILTLHGGVTEKLDAQQKEINQIRVKAAPIDSKLENLQRGIDNNNIMVRDIYIHLLDRRPRLKPYKPKGE